MKHSAPYFIVAILAAGCAAPAPEGQKQDEPEKGVIQKDIDTSKATANEASEKVKANEKILDGGK